MAKVTSPILSIGARGQIGKSQVYGSWRGVPYARQYIQPANPNTTAQQLTRNAFTMLSQRFLLMLALGRAPWLAATQGRPLTDRNQFVKTNLGPLRGELDMANFLGSPGARGGIPNTSFAVVAGVAASSLAFTVGAPAAPTGWTLDAVIGLAFPDQDPAVLPTEIATEHEEDPPVVDGDNDFEIVVPQAATTYVCSAWLRWIRPDERIAYGVASTVLADSNA